MTVCVLFKVKLRCSKEGTETTGAFSKLCGQTSLGCLCVLVECSVKDFRNSSKSTYGIKDGSSAPLGNTTPGMF